MQEGIRMNDKKLKKNVAAPGTFVGLGTALGVVFGVVFDNIGLGIALGVAFGAGLDSILFTKKK